jgi:hypothetical protein
MALERGWPDDELDPQVPEVSEVRPGQEVVQQRRSIGEQIEHVGHEDLGPIEPLRIEDLTLHTLERAQAWDEEQVRREALENVPADSRDLIKSVHTLLDVGCSFDLRQIGLPPGVEALYQQYLQDISAGSEARRVRRESEEYVNRTAIQALFWRLREYRPNARIQFRMDDPNRREREWRQMVPYAQALGMPADRELENFAPQLSDWWEQWETDPEAEKRALGYMNYIRGHQEIVHPSLPLPHFSAGDVVRVPRSDGSVSEDWRVEAVGNDGLIDVSGPERPDGQTPMRRFRQKQLGLWNKKPTDQLDEVVGVAEEVVQPLPAPEVEKVEPESLPQPEQQQAPEFAEDQVVAVVRSDGRLEHDWTIVGREADGRWIVRNARGEVKKPSTESLQKWQQVWADSLDHKASGVL